MPPVGLVFLVSVGIRSIVIIVVGVVIVGMMRVVGIVIVIIVVFRSLVVIVFFLTRRGHLPIDVQPDHRAHSVGLKQNEVPGVVKDRKRGGHRFAIFLIAWRVLETDQVVQGAREAHQEVRSLHGQLDFGRAVFVGTLR